MDNTTGIKDESANVWIKASTPTQAPMDFQVKIIGSKTNKKGYPCYRAYFVIKSPADQANVVTLLDQVQSEVKSDLAATEC